MRRHSQEEDDYRDRPPGKAYPVIWIVLAVVAVVFGAVLLVGVVGWLSLSRSGPAVAPPAVTAGSPKILMGREEWKALVGKSPDEVIAAIGRPQETIDEKQAAHVEEWHYYDRVMDPGARRAKLGVLVFENGKVSEAR